MKKILLATTLLAGSTGFAAAEVALSGDARMGIENFSTGGGDYEFTSRARVKFTLSGETDGGMSFGASFRADNAGAAAGGTAGSVFISGSFGKLEMGDVDPADKAAVGNLSARRLTDLGSFNEIIYDSADADPKPSLLYTYSAGSFTGMVSADSDNTYALGAQYAMGDYTVALGYTVDGVDDDTQVSLSGSAKFGAATVKAIYSKYDGVGTLEDQYGVSVDYVSGAIGVTAYYLTQNFTGGSADSYGLGASYDLGGGAQVIGGLESRDGSDVVSDLGVSFSF